MISLANKQHLWWAAGLATLIVFLVPVPAGDLGPLMEAWWNFGHFVWFRVLGGVVFRMYAHDRKSSVRAWLLLFPLAALLELLQSATGRDATWMDLFFGWAGNLVAGMVQGARWNIYPRVSLSLAGGLLGLATSLPVLATMDEIRIRRSFPDLSNFDHVRDMKRWNIHGCAVRAGNGWQVTILDGYDYPGLFLRSVPSDWSAMKAICVELELDDGPALPMWLRVDDIRQNPAYPDRYQSRHMMASGFNRICVDLDDIVRSGSGDRLNLSSIYTIGLFFESNAAGRTVRLMALYLDP